MSAGAYRLALFSPWNGAALPDLSYYNAINITYGVGKVGVCKITLDGTIKRAGFWIPYTTMEIWRQVAGTSKAYLEGDRLWYLMGITARHDERGASWTDLTFYDANALLNQRWILYNAETSYTKKTDYADDMIKDIIRENAGSTATDATRSMATWLTVQADKGAIASTSKSFPWRPVITVIEEICDQALNAGTYLTWDCVRTSNTTSEFRTYKGQRGVDRSAGSSYPVILSWNSGNLKSPQLIYNQFGTVNHVTACGQGTGASRVTGTAYDANLTALTRREKVIDARNVIVSNTAALTAEANGELEKSSARMRFTGNFADTEATMYGIHINYGDMVQVDYEGFVFKAHLDNIGLSLNASGEENIDIRMVSYGE